MIRKLEKPRARAIFERLGRTDCLDESWERATFERLKAGFEAKGVPVNSDDPKWSFLT